MKKVSYAVFSRWMDIVKDEWFATLVEEKVYLGDTQIYTLFTDCDNEVRAIWLWNSTAERYTFLLDLDWDNDNDDPLL